MNLTYAQWFGLTTASAFVLPMAIPGEGIDTEFWIITAFVLLAWFVFRWDAVKAITRRGRKTEVFLGASLIISDYAFNWFRGSSVGIVDLLIIFVGTIVAFYGYRSLRLFWVPATYGIVLLLGYQVVNLAPSLGALQDWLAGVMASVLNALGISSTVNGEIVSMSTSNGAPILLDVGGPCTGVQGIIAFGMLSTMALLDLKPTMARLIPVFALGFAGAFLINIVRLLLMFLTYEFASLYVAITLHIYVGYIVFIAWVVAFWAIAFRYLVPTGQVTRPSSGQAP
jgi:exosortase/archaeosortase family protein